MTYNILNKYKRKSVADEYSERNKTSRNNYIKDQMIAISNHCELLGTVGDQLDGLSDEAKKWVSPACRRKND